MNTRTQTTMAELSEFEVAGELARIYEELRVYCAVPYVSSLQRHVATMPGCLEYVWAICRPAFQDGTIPETAWNRVKMIDITPFPSLSEAASRLLGVDEVGVKAIRNICDNFVRVSPINLLFAGIVERLINGAVPSGADMPTTLWAPPEMLAPMPPMVDVNATPPNVAAVLMQLKTEIGGKPFVPGLYRLLAEWPAYLAHVSALITPLLQDEAAKRVRVSIAEEIISAADDIIAALPPAPADFAPPTAEQGRAIVSAIRTYRVTSPEMVVFGTLLRNALPTN